MEVGLRRSQRNHTYLLSAVRDQVSPARGTPDPHFYKLLLQWYTDKAQNVADVSIPYDSIKDLYIYQT
ncbi:hypothetical protein M408DRAFT_332785 [Serendipita vermifera MAFF 305830]|uniref:Uncharacterized protein n=1 Tax=Serendipita vermifera MAFF 305830 TaxID=933852 RepID=A0A0C3AU02_SERVB|nr:hypothetical protein M408DRAFT_332785 [Serendipita vermifera MAFF 305830]